MQTNVIPLEENTDFQPCQLIENEEDFYYELTAEDLRKLAIAEKQSQLGMFTDSSEVQRKAQQMINQWKYNGFTTLKKTITTPLLIGINIMGVIPILKR